MTEILFWSRGARSGVIPSVTVPSPDADLVRRLRAGDASAFDEVHAAHAPRVYSFLRRLARRADLADDLAQDTWMKFARATPTLPVETRIAPLLYTIARNNFASHRRWAALDLSRLFLLGLDALSARPPDLHEAREAAEELERVDAALQALPAGSREVLLLVGVRDLEPADVAKMLGVSPEALRKRLQRARDQLTAALARTPRPTPKPMEQPR